jgi:hypothetical protein
VIFAGPAAIAMLALFDAAQLGTGETTVASGSVRLVDQTTDMPLPPGVVLPPEVPQMLAHAAQVLASPPPNVPNEVCRYNTVRIPC